MTDRSNGFFNIPPTRGFAKTKGSKKDEGLRILKNNRGLKAAITIFDSKLVGLVVPGAKGLPIDIISEYAGFKSTVADTGEPPDITWSTVSARDNVLEFSAFSNTKNDRFAGYPLAKMYYTLTDDNRLKITYEATMAQFNILNLSNKLSLNLNGPGSGSVLNHLVQINADHYIPLEESGGPGRRTDPVTGTPFDFRKATTIGARIHDNNEQLKKGSGYNHIFVLNKHSSRTSVARIKGDKSGIIMEMYSEEQGLYFCSCNPAQSLTGEKADCRNAFAIEGIRMPGLNGHVQPRDQQVYKWTQVYGFETGR